MRALHVSERGEEVRVCGDGVACGREMEGGKYKATFCSPPHRAGALLGALVWAWARTLLCVVGLRPRDRFRAFFDDIATQDAISVYWCCCWDRRHNYVLMWALGLLFPAVGLQSRWVPPSTFVWYAVHLLHQRRCRGSQTVWRT